MSLDVQRAKNEKALLLQAKADISKVIDTIKAVSGLQTLRHLDFAVSDIDFQVEHLTHYLKEAKA